MSVLDFIWQSYWVKSQKLRPWEKRATVGVTGASAPAPSGPGRAVVADSPAALVTHMRDLASYHNSRAGDSREALATQLSAAATLRPAHLHVAFKNAKLCTSSHL